MGASNKPRLAGGDVQALRPSTHQSVAYTGTAGVITNTVKASVIRVVLTTAGYVEVGSTPTATTASMPMAADSPEYFRVEPGVDKVSAIQVASGGTLHVTEMD